VLEQGIRAAAETPLLEAGAANVLALPPGELLDTARAALESLPAHALAIGIGRELATRFEPLLGVAIGVRLEAADLELPAPSAGVASMLGAWLAERARPANKG